MYHTKSKNMTSEPTSWGPYPNNSSYNGAVTVDIPPEAETVFNAMQDPGYPLSNLKITLNPHEDDEDVVFFNTALVLQHCEYIARLLKEEYRERIFSNWGVQPKYSLHIKEDCPSYVLRELLICLCSKNVAEANTREFSIALTGETTENIRFESIHDYVLGAKVAAKWNIGFDFSQLRNSCKRLIYDYNNWYVQYNTRHPLYCNVTTPHYRWLDNNPWMCRQSYHCAAGVWNYSTAPRCVCCQKPRYPPRTVMSIPIADLTPLQPIDDRIFAAWIYFLGDDCDEFYFFCLAHASKFHRKVSHTCLNYLRKTGTHGFQLRDKGITDTIFHRTLFDVNKELGRQTENVESAGRPKKRRRIQLIPVDD